MLNILLLVILLLSPGSILAQDTPPTDTPTPVITDTPTPVSPTNTPTTTPTPTPPLPSLDCQTPSSASLGEAFSVSCRLEHANSATSYRVKTYGGIGDDNYGVQTENSGNWLGYTSAWDSMPQITTGTDGGVSFSLNSRANPNKASGDYNFKVKACLASDTDKCVYSSPTTLGITPSSTATPPPTNTSIPTPTSTHSPTLTPRPTSTHKPTVSLNPKESVTPPPDPEAEFDLLVQDESLSLDSTVVSDMTPAVLGATASNTNDSPESNFNFGKILPIILIIFGGLLLAIPLGIQKFKK